MYTIFFQFVCVFMLVCLPSLPHSHFPPPHIKPEIWVSMGINSHNLVHPSPPPPPHTHCGVIQPAYMLSMMVPTPTHQSPIPYHAPPPLSLDGRILVLTTPKFTPPPTHTPQTGVPSLFPTYYSHHTYFKDIHLYSFIQPSKIV